MAHRARAKRIIPDVEDAAALMDPRSVRRLGRVDRLRTRRLMTGAGLALWIAIVSLSCVDGRAVLLWSVIAASWVLLACIASRVLVRHARHGRGL